MESRPFNEAANRIAYAIDLDENLFSVAPVCEEGARYPLSKSAEIYLSNADGDPEGYIKGPLEATVIHDQPIHMKDICAFRRPEWKAFFAKVIDINERYQRVSEDDTPLVSCFFLTRALYTDEFTIQVFNHFYGETLTAKLAIEFEKNYFNRISQTQDITNEVNSQAAINFLSQGKGAFLEKHFQRLKEQFHLQDEKDITLVDDDYVNVMSAIKKGFSAIHHPTTAKISEQGITFTLYGKSVFTQLLAKLQPLESYVQTLEENATKRWVATIFSR